MMNRLSHEEVEKMESYKERQKAAQRWQKHLDAVQQIGSVSGSVISLAYALVTVNNIGFEQGKIRPDKKLGQWDVYYSLLQGNIPQEECLLLSGLSASEIAEQERREELDYAGVDPDSLEEVAQYERLQRMSPEELNVEIARLEKALNPPSL